MRTMVGARRGEGRSAVRRERPGVRAPGADAPAQAWALSPAGGWMPPVPEGGGVCAYVVAVVVWLCPKSRGSVWRLARPAFHGRRGRSPQPGVVARAPRPWVHCGHSLLADTQLLRIPGFDSLLL